MEQTKTQKAWEKKLFAPGAICMNGKCSVKLQDFKTARDKTVPRISATNIIGRSDIQTGDIHDIISGANYSKPKAVSSLKLE